MTMSWRLPSFFLFRFYALKEDDDELTFVIVFYCFVFMHLEKMTRSQCSLSCFFVFFLCTQRRRQLIDVHCHLLLFCFCAPKEDNNELTLVVVFFCFVSMHLEKTQPANTHHHLFCFIFMHSRENTTSWHSLSSFFVLCMCTQRKWQWATFIIVFFCFVFMHLEKTTTSVDWSFFCSCT
jgi:hypothetical protein